MNKNLLDTLHLIMCDRYHMYDMTSIIDREEGKCYYYVEADVAGGEEMPDHLRWEGILNKFKKSLNLKSDEEAFDFIKDSIDLVQKIRILSDGIKTREDFIKTLLC